MGIGLHLFKLLWALKADLSRLLGGVKTSWTTAGRLLTRQASVLPDWIALPAPRSKDPKPPLPPHRRSDSLMVASEVTPQLLSSL